MKSHPRYEYNEVRHISCRLRGGPKRKFWIYRDGNGRLHDCATGYAWSPRFYTDVVDLNTGELLNLQFEVKPQPNQAQAAPEA